MAAFYQGHAHIPTPVPSASYPGSDHSYAPNATEPDKARQLLADAGYPGGGGLKLRYVAVQGLEDERQAGLLLQDALQQMGIELQIDVLPFATFFDQAQQVDTAP